MIGVGIIIKSVMVASQVRSCNRLVSPGRVPSVADADIIRVVEEIDGGRFRDVVASHGHGPGGGCVGIDDVEFNIGGVDRERGR